MRAIAHPVFVLILALVVRPAALAAPSAPKPDSAPPAGTSAALPPGDRRLTSDEIKKLQEAIKTLHDRFTAQGVILEEVGKNLQTIRFRIDEDLHPVNLDPLKGSIAEIVRRIGELTTDLKQVASAQDKQAADATAKLGDLATALARLQEQVARLGKLEDELAQLRKTLAARAVPATAASEAPAAAPGAALAALAFCTILLAALIWLNGRAQRRAVKASLATAIAQARDQIQSGLQQSLQASSAERERALASREQSLAENLAHLQRLIDRLESPVRRLDEKAVPEGPKTVPLDEKTTIPMMPAGGSGIASNVLWPALFLDPASPLARWRALLESHLSSQEHPALPVLSALLALRTVVEGPSPAMWEVAAAVAALSSAAHAYWHSLADLGDDDRLRASSDWIGGVRKMIAASAPKLDVREIVPGGRFDPDTMQTVQEGPGNHLNVAAVFSWAILDRSAERPKVLHRARIATT